MVLVNTPTRRWPLQRGWRYVEVRSRYGLPSMQVIYMPSLFDKIVLKAQRAWRRWRAPH